MAASKLAPELFAGLLGDAIRRFLQLDPRSADALAPLAGKVIALQFTPLNLRLYLCPGADAVEILPSFEGAPDLALSGSPLAFARLGLSRSPRRALFSGAIKVEGDMDAAHDFQALFERLDIDWEAALAQWTGRSVAESLFGALRSARAWGLDSAEAMKTNLAEYWQEESRELPAHAEADIFYAQVDTLRADYDRLEARILRLEKKTL